MISECAGCGECCRRLDLHDRLCISWATKRFVVRVICVHLTHEGLCSIYEVHPSLCRDWWCEARKQALNDSLEQGSK